MEFLCKSGFALKEHPATQWNNAREEGFTRQQSSSRLQSSANMVEAGKVTGWVSNLHSWDPEQKGCHVTRPFLKQGSCFVSSISIVKYFCLALEIWRKKYQMGAGYSKEQILRNVLQSWYMLASEILILDAEKDSQVTCT